MITTDDSGPLMKISNKETNWIRQQRKMKRLEMCWSTDKKNLIDQVELNQFKDTPRPLTKFSMIQSLELKQDHRWWSLGIVLERWELGLQLRVHTEAITEAKLS